jgi:ABC-type multidrug transport system fused ATPase/permease subunit
MKMDRIIVLRNGKVEEDGTHANLIHKGSGLYKYKEQEIGKGQIGRLFQ